MHNKSFPSAASGRAEITTTRRPRGGGARSPSGVVVVSTEELPCCAFFVANTSSVDVGRTGGRQGYTRQEEAR